MKLYSIEVDTDKKFTTYCFVSLLDGARGTYTTSKEEAIEQGEAHQKIICAILPELRDLVNVERTKKRLGEMIAEKKEIEPMK
jgi:hypothetical protein